MINRFEAVVEACDRRDSHAWLLLGRCRLAARRWTGIRVGERVTVSIRPEDVILAALHPGVVSARNVLPGHATTVRRTPEGAYVTVEVGFPLTALVTRGAVEDLGIRRGRALFALLKATAIQPEVPRPTGLRVELALAGAKGVLDARRLDFLRAIARTGSITRAGREVGIAYRTAWLWVQEMHRTWRPPLVARVTGGRGGGGTSLTPAGHALLAYADRVEAMCRE